MTDSFACAASTSLRNSSYSLCSSGSRPRMAFRCPAVAKIGLAARNLRNARRCDELSWTVMPLLLLRRFALRTQWLLGADLYGGLQKRCDILLQLSQRRQVHIHHVPGFVVRIGDMPPQRRVQPQMVECVV